MDSGRRVTIVVCDLKGSTALAERLDSETLRAVLRRYFDEMGIVYESHGGVIAKIIGDALVTVFDGADDPGRAARRAVRAATEAQAALTWLNDRFDATWGVRLANRTGVASGGLPEVSLDDWHADHDVLAGEVLARAEVLEAAAPVMEVLIDDTTRHLTGAAVTTAQMGPVSGRGGHATVDAWQVVSVTAPREDVGPERPAGPARLCDVCGSANDHDARWCEMCGATLAASDVVRESRRMVTILFADPRLESDDGPPSAETVRVTMARYDTVMRPILERHGATVEKFIGDAMMAVFGLPVRHEDDAQRAVRAARDMQAALVDLNVELGDRFGVTLVQPIGVNTGTVVAGDAIEAQRLVTGDAVNVAARLEQAAAAGDVVIGPLTRRLVRDSAVTEPMPALELKGKSEPVRAHRLVEVDSGRIGRAHTLPLVGRDDDLAALRRLLRATIRGQQARRVTVIGEAGVGKSRLIHEFLTEAERTARVLSGRCLAYGEGITFWAFLEMVHAATGITDDDAADVARRRLAELVGDDPEVLARVESIAGLTDTPYAVAELGWAMRALVERHSSRGPVVLVLDDIHWAEPTFIEIVDRLASTVRGPVMLLSSARPLALEQHREFIGDAPSVVLAPFSAELCERFLLLLLGEAQIDHEVVELIAGAAGGNPLFLEQFLSMLIDDGRLQYVDGRWRAGGDLSTLEVPASIEALLAARLDRLPERERHVIEPSSVIGNEFRQEAVVALVERDVRPFVPDQLARLTDRELVELVDEFDAAFRFQHQLIRDATYNTLLKESRAILHERFVRWLDAREETRDRATELQEILGYHLEQAYHYWRELGRVDPRVEALGVDASGRLGDAGERALARGDMPAAAALLLRAADLLPDGHAARPRILLLAGGALDEAGWFDRAMTAFDDSAKAAREAGNGAAVEAATMARSRLEYLTGHTTDAEQVASQVDEALDRLTASADPDALSRAWQLRFNVDVAACRWAAAQHAANQLIEYARRAGNTILERSTLRALAFLAQKGPMPVSEATQVCRDILERVASDRRSAAMTRVDLALLTAMALDFDNAREACIEARHTLDELGADTQAALVSLSTGPIELLADQPARAEVELRRDYEALQRMGEHNFIALTAALLAEAVYRQERFDEADDLIAFSRELAAPDDLAVQIVAGCVDGKLTARRGDAATGVALLREAVRLIEATDDPSGQGDAWLDLAEALHLTGESAHAVDASEQARNRYVAKGNLAGVRRADGIGRLLRAGQDPIAGLDPRSTAAITET
ncbi:MAG TPA: adenylate/guanylate cyclase domain-containing protein [Euzebyales bacterium]